MEKYFRVTWRTPAGIAGGELPALVASEPQRGDATYYRQIPEGEARRGGDDIVFAYPGFRGTSWEPGRPDQVLTGTYGQIVEALPRLEDAQYAAAQGFFGVPISEEALGKIRRALAVLRGTEWV